MWNFGGHCFGHEIHIFTFYVNNRSANDEKVSVTNNHYFPNRSVSNEKVSVTKNHHFLILKKGQLGPPPVEKMSTSY